MDILFEDKDLKKCATDMAYALKKLGQRRALRYVDRLVQIVWAKERVAKMLEIVDYHG